MYIGIHVKYPLFLGDYNGTCIFSTNFRKIPQISNFMKIRPVGVEMFHADGRTHMTKLTVAFRDFAKASNKRWSSQPRKQHEGPGGKADVLLESFLKLGAAWGGCVVRPTTRAALSPWTDTGWVPGRSVRMRKISHPRRFDIRTVQPVVTPNRPVQTKWIRI